jgi:hypothetical protein
MGKLAKRTLTKAKSRRFTESAISAVSPGTSPVVNPSDDLTPDRLNSWKEISAYLGREIRTCYRWAIELGLPVRRIDSASARSRVFAFRDDLDKWLRDRDPYSASSTVVPTHGEKAVLRAWVPRARSRGKQRKHGRTI